MKRTIALLLALLLAACCLPAAAVFAEGAENDTRNELIPADDSEELVAGFYFEDASELTDWALLDADGDGYNWSYNIGGTNNSNMAYESQGCMISSSYISNVGALSPDNWLISCPVELPAGSARVSFYLGAQDPNYAAEHYAVYAGTSADAAAMTCVFPESVATAGYTRYEADLSAFAGQTVYIAFRHFNCTDMFILKLDNVEVWGSSELPEHSPVFFNMTDLDYTAVTSVEDGGTGIPASFDYSSYTYFNVGKRSGMYSLGFLIDYPEEFVSVEDLSSSFASGLISDTNLSWNDGTQESDKFSVVTNTAYEGGTGGVPHGEAGNMYVNGGCYVTSFQYGGVQISGSILRIALRLNKTPSTEDCLHDEHGWYLPIGLSIHEFSYGYFDDDGTMKHSENVCADGYPSWFSTEDGKLYVVPSDEPVPTAAPTAVPTAEPTDEPNAVNFYVTDLHYENVSAVDQGGSGLADAAADRYFYYGVTSGSGMFAHGFLIDYPEEYVSIVDSTVTWSGGVIAQINASWDDGGAWSDKLNVVCNLTYEGGSGGVPHGEAGNMYINGGSYETTYQYMGLQMGGHLARFTLRLDKAPMLEECLQDANGYYLPLGLSLHEFEYAIYEPGIGGYVASDNFAQPEYADWLSSTDGKLYVTPRTAQPDHVEFSLNELHYEEVTAYNDNGTGLPGAAADSWLYVDITDHSGMYSSHFLIDYPEQFVSITGASATFAGGVIAAVNAAIADGTQWSDQLNVVYNYPYTGGSGGVPVGEAGNVYVNVGTYQTSFQFLGLQMGGHLARFKVRLDKVPAFEDCVQDDNGWYLPIPLKLVEFTYNTVNPQSGSYMASDNCAVPEYAEWLTAVDGKLYVTPRTPEPEYVEFYLNDVDYSGVKAVSDGGTGVAEGDCYLYLGITEGSGMYACQYLIDYPEQFVSIAANSSTWAGSIIAQIIDSWDEGEATSDKFESRAVTAYVGGTGGVPVGEEGNVYVNGGCYITTFNYMGVQAGGVFHRFKLRLDNAPQYSECLRDSNGWYLPIGLELIEFEYTIRGAGGVTSSGNCCLSEYAEWFNVTGAKLYVKPALLVGDVNGDGVISLADAAELFNRMMNGGTMTDEELYVCDMNGDGVASFADIAAIYYFVIGGN